jgi:hypothetical protein
MTFVLRLLTRRFGEVPAEVRAEIAGLSVAQLEDLGEAVLDFASWVDLQQWLSQHNRDSGGKARPMDIDYSSPKMVMRSSSCRTL